MQELIEVPVTEGTIVGRRQAGVCRFDAIPYAEPPVGELRFRPPRKLRWQGRLDAIHRGPIAPQRRSRLAPAIGDFHADQSEDCLHLTVWTPAADHGRRPVVVWLHGGAWVTGAGALDWYDGTNLAVRGDMVVVAPNYRLGALGWLHVPGETANVGLLDQEAAIDWVIEHIDAFGGDPERITVMGQSAGASNAACLLTRAPRFSRVILQSSSLGRGLWTSSKAADLARHVLDAAGVGSLEEARALSADALVEAQHAPGVQRFLAEEGSGRAAYCPTADGDVLPVAYEQALRQAATRADVLVGHTLNEMASFPGWGLDADAQRVGDLVFGAFARQWAAWAAEGGRDARLYRFDYSASSRFGACHCVELPFVFDTLESYVGSPMLDAAEPVDLARLAAQVQMFWVAFIRGEGPAWPPYPKQYSFN